MKITAIKQQERLKGRYSIYIDERYAFSLSADALLEEKLVPGFELDEQRLRYYKKLSVDDKAYGLVLAYLARRMRSEGELTDYFFRKGYDTAFSRQLMKRLRQIGMVDDTKFAEAWVRNRRLLRQTSTRRLVQELRQKHVADEIIEQVLHGDETDEDVMLQELVVRKRRLSRYQDDIKLVQYLARQGFSYDAIKRALASGG